MKNFVADRGLGEPACLHAALLAGKKAPPSVVTLLEDDHRTVLGWFKWYEMAADDVARTRVAKNICAVLAAHMAAEKEIFYPAAARDAGSDTLTEHFIVDHANAKILMTEIANAQYEKARDVAVRRLRDVVRAHVGEEEQRLLDDMRRSEADLYALGSAVAARRADHLFDQAQKARESGAELKEYPAMPISEDEARQQYVKGLKNLHAAATEGRTLVKAQISRLERYPAMKARLAQHLPEKEAQLTRLEGLLEACGEQPSAAKDAASFAGAAASAVMHAAAADEVIKNSFASLALSKYEAAAYETLLLFGAAAGETKALKTLQQSLSEERGFSAFIEENLRGVGMQFLQLKSEGARAGR